MVYRLIAQQQPGRIDYCAQIHADEEWLTLADWSVSTPGDLPARKVADMVRAESAEAGWILGEKVANTPRTYEAKPADWHRILQEASTRRTAKMHEAEQADHAWRLLIQDAPTAQGAPGYVAVAAIAKMAGVTRHRIYQVVRGQGDEPAKE